MSKISPNEKSYQTKNLKFAIPIMFSFINMNDFKRILVRLSTKSRKSIWEIQYEFSASRSWFRRNFHLCKIR